MCTLIILFSEAVPCHRQHMADQIGFARVGKDDGGEEAGDVRVALESTLH